MSTEEKLKAIVEAVIDGEQGEAETSTQEALEEMDGARILKYALIPAIREMGESMVEGEFFMPEIKMATKCLKAVSDVLRAHVVPEENLASYTVPPWTWEGDINDIGGCLKKKMEESADLPPQEQMGLLDMITTGIATHEFVPCKVQAAEADK